MPSDRSEIINLRVTVITGQRTPTITECDGAACPGRITKATGAPHDAPPWSWSWPPARQRPQARNDRGSGVDLDDGKVQLREAWSRIRPGLIEAEIAHARRVAEVSAEALARYGRRGRP
jgi:hypothetical protein